MLEDGRWLLFTLTTEPGSDRWDRAQIVAQNMRTAERKVLIRGGSAAHYVPTGHLVYALGGVLYAVPFDVKKMEARGDVMPDGTQLVVVMDAVSSQAAASKPSRPQIDVVLNWFEELKQRVPMK